MIRRAFISWEAALEYAALLSFAVLGYLMG